jgi:type VI secretion system secreted protein Hcp
MAVDAFLKMDGIAGESQDSKHKGEIEVESFSWGASQSGSFSFGGGGGAGKVQFQDFHFVTGISKASPLLLKACATGEHIKEATITVRKSGGESQLDFMFVKMNDVLVSSYSSAGSRGDALPSDQVSLMFAKIDFTIKTQSADGSLGGEVRAGWDLKANKAV